MMIYACLRIWLILLIIYSSFKNILIKTGCRNCLLKCEAFKIHLKYYVHLKIALLEKYQYLFNTKWNGLQQEAGKLHFGFSSGFWHPWETSHCFQLILDLACASCKSPKWWHVSLAVKSSKVFSKHSLLLVRRLVTRHRWKYGQHN